MPLSKEVRKMNDSDENFILKIKKLVEKYGWIIIVILAIALVISLIAVIQEKSKKKEGT
jgi:hypothetical protein